MSIKNKPPKPTDAPVFSHSQLSVMDDCFKKWEYQYKLEKIRPSTGAMYLGSAIHAYFERYYKRMIATGGRPRKLTQEDQQVIFGEPFDDDFGGGEVLIRAQTLTRYYLEMVESYDQFLVYMEAEQHFYVPYILPSGRKCYFELIIDLIAMDIRDHTLVVIDHKSSGKPWEQKAANLDAQLPLYMNALRIIGRPVGKAIINNVITYKYKDMRAAQEAGKLFSRLYINKSDIELRNIMDQLSYRIDLLLDMDNYPMVLTKSTCGGCSYIDVCQSKLRGDEAGAELLLETQFIDKNTLIAKPKESFSLQIVRRNSSPEPLDKPEPIIQNEPKPKVIKVDW